MRLGTAAVQKTDAGVILLAKTGTAEQIADKLQDFGVLVLGKPFTAVQFRQAVQIAASNYKRLAVLRAENAKLLDKIAQLRLVDRAKCYLIEKKGHDRDRGPPPYREGRDGYRRSRGEVAWRFWKQRRNSTASLPFGGRWPKPRPRPDEGQCADIEPQKGKKGKLTLISRFRGQLLPGGKPFDTQKRTLSRPLFIYPYFRRPHNKPPPYTPAPWSRRQRPPARCRPHR